MKYLFLVILALAGTGVSFAQSGSAKQVNWTYTTKKIAENTYEVRITAQIYGDYHMYAQNAGIEGPVPTTLKYAANPLLTIDGKAKEVGKMIKKFESAWDGNVKYY